MRNSGAAFSVAHLREAARGRAISSSRRTQAPHEPYLFVSDSWVGVILLWVLGAIPTVLFLATFVVMPVPEGDSQASVAVGSSLESAIKLAIASLLESAFRPGSQLLAAAGAFGFLLAAVTLHLALSVEKRALLASRGRLAEQHSRSTEMWLLRALAASMRRLKTPAEQDGAQRNSTTDSSLLTQAGAAVHGILAQIVSPGNLFVLITLGCTLQPLLLFGSTLHAGEVVFRAAATSSAVDLNFPNLTVLTSAIGFLALVSLSSSLRLSWLPSQWRGLRSDPQSVRHVVTIPLAALSSTRAVLEGFCVSASVFMHASVAAAALFDDTTEFGNPIPVSTRIAALAGTVMLQATLFMSRWSMPDFIDPGHALPGCSLCAAQVAAAVLALLKGAGLLTADSSAAAICCCVCAATAFAVRYKSAILAQGSSAHEMGISSRQAAFDRAAATRVDDPRRTPQTLRWLQRQAVQGTPMDYGSSAFVAAWWALRQMEWHPKIDIPAASQLLWQGTVAVQAAAQSARSILLRQDCDTLLTVILDKSVRMGQLLPPQWNSEKGEHGKGPGQVLRAAMQAHNTAVRAQQDFWTSIADGQTLNLGPLHACAQRFYDGYIEASQLYGDAMAAAKQGVGEGSEVPDTLRREVAVLIPFAAFLQYVMQDRHSADALRGRAALLSHHASQMQAGASLLGMQAPTWQDARRMMLSQRLHLGASVPSARAAGLVPQLAAWAAVASSGKPLMRQQGWMTPPTQNDVARGICELCVSIHPSNIGTILDCNRNAVEALAGGRVADVVGARLERFVPHRNASGLAQAVLQALRTFDDAWSLLGGTVLLPVTRADGTHGVAAVAVKYGAARGPAQSTDLVHATNAMPVVSIGFQMVELPAGHRFVHSTNPPAELLPGHRLQWSRRMCHLMEVPITMHTWVVGVRADADGDSRSAVPTTVSRELQWEAASSDDEDSRHSTASSHDGPDFKLNTGHAGRNGRKLGGGSVAPSEASRGSLEDPLLGGAGMRNSSALHSMLLTFPVSKLNLVRGPHRVAVAAFLLIGIVYLFVVNSNRDFVLRSTVETAHSDAIFASSATLSAAMALERGSACAVQPPGACIAGSFAGFEAQLSTSSLQDWSPWSARDTDRWERQCLCTGMFRGSTLSTAQQLHAALVRDNVAGASLAGMAAYLPAVAAQASVADTQMAVQSAAIGSALRFAAAGADIGNSSVPWAVRGRASMLQSLHQAAVLAAAQYSAGAAGDQVTEVHPQALLAAQAVHAASGGALEAMPSLRTLREALDRDYSLVQILGFNLLGVIMVAGLSLFYLFLLSRFNAQRRLMLGSLSRVTTHRARAQAAHAQKHSDALLAGDKSMLGSHSDAASPAVPPGSAPISRRERIAFSWVTAAEARSVLSDTSFKARLMGITCVVFCLCAVQLIASVGINALFRESHGIWREHQVYVVRQLQQESARVALSVQDVYASIQQDGNSSTRQASAASAARALQVSSGRIRELLRQLQEGGRVPLWPLFTWNRGFSSFIQPLDVGIESGVAFHSSFCGNEALQLGDKPQWREQHGGGLFDLGITPPTLTTALQGRFVSLRVLLATCSTTEDGLLLGGGLSDAAVLLLSRMQSVAANLQSHNQCHATDLHAYLQNISSTASPHPMDPCSRQVETANALWWGVADLLFPGLQLLATAVEEAGVTELQAHLFRRLAYNLCLPILNTVVMLAVIGPAVSSLGTGHLASAAFLSALPDDIRKKSAVGKALAAVAVEVHDQHQARRNVEA